MKSLALALFVLLLLPLAAMGQTTTVTGTITDAGGQAWTNGTYSIAFVGSGPGPYVWTGGAFNPNNVISGSLNGSGAFSVSVPDNNTITPTPSQWKICVTPQVPIPSGNYCATLTITGASKSVSGSLIPPAILIPVPIVPSVVNPVSTYADGEISGGWVGFQYYNLTNSISRVCQTVTSGSCSSWANGGGGGFTPAGDLSGSSSSQEVVGVLSNTLPSLTTGYLNWTGSAWSFNNPSGTGTVTIFSAGTLSPLFTTSVATATSTPALSFALTAAAQNSVFAGPPTGGAGAPSYQTAPTFSAANLTNFPASLATYPGAGIANSTGSAWGTSYTTSGSGSVLCLVTSCAMVTPNLGTPSAINLTNATSPPTWNQNTTGSAAKWTTARNLAGNSVDGSANVAFTNKFIVQGTTDAGLSGAQFLGALSTGPLKVTTTTGVLGTALAADIYGLWSGSCTSSTFLRGDGACATPSGSGTVTVVGAGSLTSTALVTGGGSQTLQTPSATSTLDGSGNLAVAGTITAGAGGNAYTAPEGTCTAGTAANDVFCADSTAHRWKMFNNNGSAVQIVASGADINTSDQVTVTHLASALPVNQGGTAATTAANALISLFPAATRAGDVYYWNGSIFTNLAGNNSGTNCFGENSSGVPSWQTCSGGSGITNPGANGIVACTGTACSTSSARTITGTSPVGVTNGDGVSGNPTIAINSNGITATQLATQYAKLRCEPGLGDGLNAIAAGTYLQSTCYNDSGVTWTITGIKCFTDNGGSSTLNAAGNTLGALLTGAVTCTSSFAAGTQSANVALTSGDYIKFTFVADGTSKQTTWIVSMTQ